MGAGRTTWRRVGVGVLIALVGSLGVNFYLYHQAKGLYARLASVRLDPLGLGRYPQGVKVEAGGKTVAVLLGDSRAAMWPAPQVEGWGFVNRGITDQGAAQVVGRFEAHVGSLGADVVVLQVGINDLKAIGVLPQERERIVAEVKRNVREIVARARSAGMRVVVCTIFPTGPVGVGRRAIWSDDIEAARAEVNRELRMLGEDGVVIFDAEDVLAPGGRMKGEFAADTLHLTGAGYAALNQRLVDILRALKDR